MSMIESQITSLKIVYSTVYSGADQGKHQSFTGLFDRNSLVTGQFLAQRPVTWKMFRFDDIFIRQERGSNLHWLNIDFMWMCWIMSSRRWYEDRVHIEDQIFSWVAVTSYMWGYQEIARYNGPQRPLLIAPLTFIPAWLSNDKLWDEIIYPFPNSKVQHWKFGIA